MTELARSEFRRRALSAGALLAACVALASCAHDPPHAGGAPSVSSSPGVPWKPPAEAYGRSAPAPKPTIIPADLAAYADSLTLPRIVDLALRASPQTRAAWATARAAAAAYGSRRGAWWPAITAGTSYTRQESAAPEGGLRLDVPGVLQPSLDFEYLLFNFGGRKADVSAAKQALYAASWEHNAAIQDVTFQVEQAYYDYFTAKALAASQQASVDEAKASLDAAEQRHQAGLATIADVLQARTAYSQAQLSEVTLQGQIATTRGALATAMGIPANTSFDISLPDSEPPIPEMSEAVEHYLAVAEKARPDLAAARARALEARAHVRSVRAEGYPAFTSGVTVDRNYFDDGARTTDAYLASVRMRLPLFTGFSHSYDVQQAKAEADFSEAQLESERQTVVLDVWTSYYDLKTAEQRVRTSRDLLQSATESQQVALGRYRAGVGSILDLLAAQSSLENARAQSLQARSDWFIAVARLAHATGTLSLSQKE